MPPKKKKVEAETTDKNKITTQPNQQSQSKDININNSKDTHEKQFATSQKSNMDNNGTLSNRPNKQQDRKTIDFYQQCLADSTLKLQGKTQNNQSPNEEQQQRSRKRTYEQLQITQEQEKPQKRVKKQMKYNYNQIVSQIINEDPKLLEERRKKFCTIEQNSGPAIYQEPLPIRNENKMNKLHKKKQQNIKQHQKSSRGHETFRETKIKDIKQKETRHKQIRPKETKPQDNHQTKRRNSPQRQSRHKSKHSHRHQSGRQGERYQQHHYKSYSNSRRSQSRHHHRHHRR